MKYEVRTNLRLLDEQAKSSAQLLTLSLLFISEISMATPFWSDFSGALGKLRQVKGYHHVECLVENISWQDFEQVDLRVGTIVTAEVFTEARCPAYILHVNFGAEIGVLKSSAQIADLYQPEVSGPAGDWRGELPAQANWAPFNPNV